MAISPLKERHAVSSAFDRKKESPANALSAPAQQKTNYEAAFGLPDALRGADGADAGQIRQSTGIAWNHLEPGAH
jgi:hypothetical protein